MSSLAGRALAEACKQGAADQDLERIDRAPDDAVLLTFRAGRGHRWMRFDGARIEVLSLENDAELPIAARLARVAAGGPLEILAYKPGRRLVLRQNTGAAARILKAYRRKRVAGAVRCHVTAALAVEGSLFRVPWITARDDSLACFAMRDLGRDKLHLGRLSSDWFERMGRALRLFQAWRPDIELLAHDVAAELGLLDRAAENAVFLTGVLPARWTRVRAMLGRAGGALHSRPLVLAHRDFHDGQLVRTPPEMGGVGLLDFDLLCRADACLDVANLAAHLELRALQGSAGLMPERARRRSRELCAGHGTEASSAHFCFYSAATFLRLALVYHLRPQWAHLPPELVQHAERSLQEVHDSVA